MIPLMTVEPQAFMTLPKTPAAVFSDEPIERLNHWLVTCRRRWRLHQRNDLKLEDIATWVRPVLVG